MEKLSVDRAMKLARSHARKGDTSAARDLYGSILAQYPANRRARAALAALTERAGADRCQVAHAGSDKPPDAEIEALIARFEAGSLEAVITGAEALSKRYPKAFMPLHLLGSAAAALGRHDHAEAVLRRAIALKPNAPETLNNLGNVLRERGSLDAAADQYGKALRLCPDYVEALCNLGHVLVLQGRVPQAISVYARALRRDAGHAEAHNGLGRALDTQGRSDEAVDCFRRAVTLRPAFFDAWMNLGRAHLASEAPDEAEAAFRHAAERRPQAVEPWLQLGLARERMGDAAAAREAYRAAAERAPEHPTPHYKLGVLFRKAGRAEEAAASYDAALARDPDHAEALNDLGYLRLEEGDREEAERLFRRAMAAGPRLAQARYNLAVALDGTPERAETAIAALEEALTIRPAFPEALRRLGHLHVARKAFDRASDAFRRLVALEPRNAEGMVKLAQSLVHEGAVAEARGWFARALEIAPDDRKALYGFASLKMRENDVQGAEALIRRHVALDPDSGDAWEVLGNALMLRSRRSEAVEAFDRVLALDPDRVNARVQRIHQLAHLCDWDAMGDLAALLEGGGLDGAVLPWVMLALEDDPERQMRRSIDCARRSFGAARDGPPHPLEQVVIGASEEPRAAALGGCPTADPVAAAARAPRRLRIGYFSADFHDHATLFLMSGLLREHDPDRFEVVCYSYGARQSGFLRDAAMQDVDRFVDVRGWRDGDIVEFAKRDSLDIAIDLKGFTREHRLGLFAHRLAPVQVSYLGYPGTLGTDFIDYIVADEVVVPDAARPYYTERVLYLPNCYQPNDDMRVIDATPTTRADFGLPEDAFVFASFNASYKIGPREFDIWMRLLEAVPRSVLWLLAPGDTTRDNLRRAARARGVHDTRLVFAGNLPQAQHLARQRHADLFLDSFNVNAHTTASDALWAGLPVLTRAGLQFAARVAASLLHAMDLPDLVTQTDAAYEARAIELANDPAALAMLRTRLAERIRTAPLFDTRRYARDFERGLEAIWARSAAGLPPADIRMRSD